MAKPEREVERIVQRDAEVQKAIKVLQERQFKGKEAKRLRLPPLLEQRRKEHLIPNGAFRERPVYDWVHVYQLGDKDEAGPETTYGDTSIIMPERSRDVARDESPRGIIVSAGPLALDELRSNGVDLGHIIRFVRLSPYRIIVDNVLGRDFTVLVLRSGAITASQDLEDEVRDGNAKLELRETPEGQQHVWKKKNKTQKAPTKPWVPADYE